MAGQCTFTKHHRTEVFPFLFPALFLSRFLSWNLSAPPTHWRSICLVDRNPYFSHPRYFLFQDPSTPSLHLPGPVAVRSPRRPSTFQLRSSWISSQFLHTPISQTQTLVLVSSLKSLCYAAFLLFQYNGGGSLCVYCPWGCYQRCSIILRQMWSWKVDTLKMRAGRREEKQLLDINRGVDKRRRAFMWIFSHQCLSWLEEKTGRLPRDHRCDQYYTRVELDLKWSTHLPWQRQEPTWNPLNIYFSFHWVNQ